MPSEQREPLWATSLAPDPRPDGVAADAGPDEGPDPRPEVAPTAAPDLLAARALAVVLCSLAALIAIALALTDDRTVQIDTVPSAWLEVPMDCDTLRLEQDGQAVELFSCRATAGGVLPAGTYRPPDSQWTSDLTRQDALTSYIVISPEGELTGIAAYVT